MSNNSLIKMNKKGGEKLLSMWWFFILGVVGGFIVMGVMIYYSADTNVNSIEASILTSKLSECINSHGEINPELFEEDFDIVKTCGLDVNTFGPGSFVYFNVSIYNNDIFLKEFVNGSGAFEVDCKISKNINARNFPSCNERNFLGYLNGDLYRIHILAGSNQIGSKVPLTN